MWSHNLAEDYWLQNKFSIREYSPESIRMHYSIRSSRIVLYKSHKINHHIRHLPVARSRKNLKCTKLATIILIIVASINLSAANYQDEVLSSLSSSSPISVNHKQAQFVEPEGDENVHTVAVGRPIKFKCVVNNLGDRKVAWFHKDKRVLLALDNKTITRNDRIHASSQADSVFSLQIDSVQLGDKGHYSCQLNTQPTQSLFHTLNVIQSPQIKEDETTLSIEPVKEFSSVELKCAADGIPKPTIKWRRESQMHVIPAFDADDEEQAEDGSLSQVDGNAISSQDTSGAAPQMAASSWLTDDDNDSGSDSGGDRDIGIGKAQRRVQRHSADSSGALPSPGSGSSSQNSESTDTVVEDTQERKWRRRRRRQMIDAAEAKSDDTASGEIGGVTSATRSRPTQAVATSPALTAATLTEFSSTATTTTTTTGQLSAISSASANATSNGSNNNNKSFIGEGEVLRIDRISRYDMGFYQCIASNGVPPSVSQRIFLPVSFVTNTRAASVSRSHNGKNLAAAAAAGGLAPPVAASAVASHSAISGPATVSANGSDNLSRATRPTAGTATAGRSTLFRQQHRKHQRTTASSAATSSSATATTTPQINLIITTTNFMAAIIWIYLFNIIYFSCNCYCNRNF